MRRDREELAMRLARSEAEADSAFRRIDEALRTMARRLETNERSQNEAQRAMSTAASEISAATRDQAEAFVLLTQRIDRVEQNSDTAALRDAVRGLHQGLSRLTEQIVSTASESSGQIAKLTGNLDAMSVELAAARDDSSRVERSLEERLNAFSQRLNDVEEKSGPDTRLEETVSMLESRIDSAEERLQQALTQHLAAIERNLEGIAKKLDLAERSGEEAQNQGRENLRHLGQRLDAAEKRVKDAAAEAKSNLSHAVKRIERLEASTESEDETVARRLTLAQAATASNVVAPRVRLGSSRMIRTRKASLRPSRMTLTKLASRAEGAAGQTDGAGLSRPNPARGRGRRRRPIGEPQRRPMPRGAIETFLSRRYWLSSWCCRRGSS